MNADTAGGDTDTAWGTRITRMKHGYRKGKGKGNAN